MEFILGFITAIFTILVIKLIWTENSKKNSKSSSSIIERIKARGEADTQVREKLISMLGGDKEKAEALVARKRFGKEGRYSENYYWWLVIRELERKNGNE